VGGIGVAGGDYIAGLDLGAPTLARHGTGPYVQPHLIDHVANLRSLEAQGCDRVVAVGSVGGLRLDLVPGTFVCPDDFIALAEGGGSVFDDRRGHAVPGFDADLRGAVVGAWSRAASPPLVDGGTYWQATGPRFETPAEIRLMSAHADVVGMTIASEAVAARELGLGYAAVCMVDNLANGLGDEPLTLEELEAARAANRVTLEAALRAVLPELA
jgi:5'-methylthioadenosine phosphorylase